MVVGGRALTYSDRHVDRSIDIHVRAPRPPPILRQITPGHHSRQQHLRVVGMNATAGATSERRRAATFILSVVAVLGGRQWGVCVRSGMD